MCLGVKPVGEPDAGNPHVRFDERRRETAAWCGLRHRRSAKAAGPATPRTCPDRARLRLYSEEQRSQPQGPQRGSRVGVEEGCSAGRMQQEFHHGLLGRRIRRDDYVKGAAAGALRDKLAARGFRA